MWRTGAQNHHEHFNLGPFDEQCLQSENMWQHNRFLPVAHPRASTQKTPNPCTTASCVSHPKCSQAFCVHCGAFRRRFLRHRLTSDRCAAVDNEAVVAEAAGGARNGAAECYHSARKLVCVCVFVCVSSSSVLGPYFDPCLKCAFFIKFSHKNRNVFVSHHRTTLGLQSCRAAKVASVTSGHRARQQQRPGEQEGGALASEAGDVWVKMVSLTFTFWSPLQVMQRLGEAQRPHTQGPLLQRTRLEVLTPHFVAPKDLRDRCA